MRLHRFHGGLQLAPHKAESTGTPIQACPLPGQLLVPLLQHAGAPARPCVHPGEKVLRGQRIGSMQGERGAHVHAPSSGTVAAIVPGAVAHAPDATSDAVLIDCDGADAWQLLEPIADPLQASAGLLLQRIADAGVVGLGGACFPTAEKLAVARELLVLNGAECEPWIACDDRLLRERAEDVVRGGLLLARITGATRSVLAIEDSMPEALQCARAASAANGALVEVVAVPTIYPEGGERQLIRALTGREVPRGGLPRDLGVVVHNVGTAAAAWRAVAHGEALTTRVVTVTGAGVLRPGNFEARIGTPVATLVEAAGGYTEHAARLLVGGPMMGQALAHDSHPVTKATNCVLVLGRDELREAAPTVPCIRCSACARVCPANLLPQQLYWFLGGERWSRAEEHGLFDCIECGCCDLVCPSHLPLVEWFRFGKTEVAARARDAELAADARQRFEARQRRQQREEAERAARRARAGAPEAMRAALQQVGAAPASGRAAPVSPRPQRTDAADGPDAGPST